jgi:hypothetical protein
MYKTVVSSAKFFNSREDNLFFESEILVLHNADNVWMFFKNLKNVHLWHPHMYLVKESASNSETSATYGNYISYFSFGKQTISLADINHDTKTIRCKVSGDPSGESGNFFEISVVAVDDTTTTIFFKRFRKFTKVTTSHPRTHHEILSNIAMDITYRLMNLEYDDMAYLENNKP